MRPEAPVMPRMSGREGEGEEDKGIKGNWVLWDLKESGTKVLS
jgi:hypothetical protein